MMRSSCWKRRNGLRARLSESNRVRKGMRKAAAAQKARTTAASEDASAAIKVLVPGKKRRERGGRTFSSSPESRLRAYTVAPGKRAPSVSKGAIFISPGFQGMKNRVRV